MDIRWAAPSLAKQIPTHVAYARSAKAGAPIYADEEVLMHAQWRHQKIGQNKSPGERDYTAIPSRNRISGPIVARQGGALHAAAKLGCIMWGVARYAPRMAVSALYHMEPQPPELPSSQG